MQILLTDPDARHDVAKPQRQHAQSAVDTEHHIFVAHDVKNIGIDNGHLGSMHEQARGALEAESIEACADIGHFESEEIAACEAAGIATYMPRPLTSDARTERPIRSPGFRLRRSQRHAPSTRTATRRSLEACWRSPSGADEFARVPQ